MGTGRIRDGVECGQSTIAREVVTIIITIILTMGEEQVLMPHRRTGDISQERIRTPGTTIHTITTTISNNNNNCTEGRPGRRVTGTEIRIRMVTMDKEGIGHQIINRGHRIIAVVEEEEGDLVGITIIIMEDLLWVKEDRMERVEEGMLMGTRTKEEEEDTTDRCIITMIKEAVVMVQEEDMIIIPITII